jgi:hypothetical protein
MYSHFESVELQHERCQRQPQIIQFPGPGIVAVFHDEFRLRFEAPPPADRKPRHTDARLTDGDQIAVVGRQYEGMVRPVEGKSAALPERRITNVLGDGGHTEAISAQQPIRAMREPVSGSNAGNNNTFFRRVLMNCQYFR